MTLIPFGEDSPAVAPTAFVAATATLIGAVTIGADSGVYFGAVVRADSDAITIGARSNVQDNVSIHTDRGIRVVIGDDVSIGHGAVVHGCEIGNGCLIGMNSTVLNRAVIGAGSLVAAGAVVLEGTIVPPGSLVAGVPAKVRRALTDEELAGLQANADVYVERSAVYREALGHEALGHEAQGHEAL